MTLWGCEVPAKSHSDDMVEVWMGEPEPMILCGYHASQAGPAVYKAVRDARLAAHSTPVDAVPNDLEEDR